jgi:hypothetical protein
MEPAAIYFVTANELVEGPPAAARHLGNPCEDRVMPKLPQERP